MMSGLPEGWVSAKLGDICGSGQYGWTAKAADQGEVKYLRTTDITKGQINWDTVPYCQEVPKLLDKYQLQKNDILISRAGSVGFSTLISCIQTSTVFASYLIRFVPLENSEPRYIAYFLRTPDYWRRISEASAGIALANINAKKLAELQIPLPPLNEQKRIADKLDALLARVDACRERLDRVPVILKRFRQAVLAAATSGGLTEEWRENHRSPGAPRHPLPKGEGTVLPTDVPPLHEREGRGEGEGLPEGWCISCVGKVSESLKYGTSQKCSYEKNGVPVLRIPNIGEGLIGHADLKFADLPDKEFQLLRLQPGDILVIRSNGSVSLVGKSALVREAEKDFAYAGYLIRIRPDQAKVLPEYLNLTLQSHKVRLQIEIPARSTSGVNNINSDELKALSFNLPPLHEQNEIVRRVETLFAFADRLEARYNTARKQVDNLTPSLLAKAFRGELVPQEES